MTRSDRCEPRPFFLPIAAGKLFCLYFPGNEDAYKGHAVVHVPAFAEEMNKARRMVALQARALAERGISVLTVDLFGTGDSDGDTLDARWSQWLQDMEAAIAWLRGKQVKDISLWALRAGALLALDFLHYSDKEFKSLLLWQPILKGEIFLTQFLRLRVAAGMMTGKRETVRGLRDRFAEGESLEIAGYELHPEWVREIEKLDFETTVTGSLQKLGVFEISSTLKEQPTPANQQFLSIWASAGINTHYEAIVGEPFWSTQEITSVPELIQLSSTFFEC
ncbi:hydrolase 2, exosortase A system-associated [Methylocaldum szegediense]|jgi:exosortase A-associated hydrolase 2|uniref:Hydrolase 2, exosortase A system-associated n=1 Tax=Methylocaldum szegediense TaxID=73780 RepID=A0ABN8XDZ7_9GAMM|nr:hydrolase 2, exosortase A system-associated [Methylocaldum szegediense]CAI8966974.1 Hydrolase 2, exosortase A system-associated [Methylocaldum szegediense]